jgi:hypothetical protein
MLAVIVYCAAMVAANLSVATFGPWISPLNAFLFIGLDLSLRDHLHDKWRGDGLWLRMPALILAAGIISFLLNPAAGMIALASFVAFLVAGLVDAVVYHQMRHAPFLLRSNGSNMAGALADSLIFPTLAFGGFLPAIVALQFVAKVGGGFVWSLLLRRREVA